MKRRCTRGEATGRRAGGPQGEVPLLPVERVSVTLVRPRARGTMNNLHVKGPVAHKFANHYTGPGWFRIGRRGGVRPFDKHVHVISDQHHRPHPRKICRPFREDRKRKYFEMPCTRRDPFACVIIALIILRSTSHVLEISSNHVLTFLLGTEP